MNDEPRLKMRGWRGNRLRGKNNPRCRKGNEEVERDGFRRT